MRRYSPARLNIGSRLTDVIKKLYDEGSCRGAVKGVLEVPHCATRNPLPNRPRFDIGPPAQIFLFLAVLWVIFLTFK